MRFSDFLLVSDPTDLDFIVGYTDEQNIRINVLDLFAGQIIGGGTPGYVPVFTAENVIDDSVIFQHGTNIVIGGVDSLGYKLAVSGSLYASNGAVINSTALGADALRVIAVDGDIFVIPNDLGQSISSLRRIAHPPAVLTTESATLGQLNTAISNLEGDIEILLDLKVDKSSVGEPNGVASLDATGKIPLSEIPDSIIGQVEYMGTWNAFTNTPTLNSLIPEQKGHYYVVSAAGVFGGVDYQVGDWIISNGLIWEKVDNTDAVTSVFGRIGAILALEGDYQAFYPRLSQYYDNPTWINTLAFTKITGVPAFLLENQTITLSGDVTGSGKTSIVSTISNNAVSNEKLRDSIGTSVIGRSASTTGDPADIQATTDGHVLLRSAGNLLFGLISGDSISSIDWSKITGTPTTLSGYGITDAYTKTESDNKFVPYTGASSNVNLGSNNITANSFIKAGGTSSQFLKADGSVDTSQYVPTTRSVNAGTGLTGGGNLSSDITIAFDTTWGDNRYAYRTRQLTINGTTYDLSADRTWNVGTVTSIGIIAPLTGGTITSSGIIGITQSGSISDGYLSSTDWNTFNNKQGSLTLTTTGTSGPSTLIGNTLNIPQYTDQFVGTVTSVGLSMPSAFNVSNSPITSSGTIAVTGAGTASQYVRGDGTLADFPSGGGGGGSSVSYYLNGSVNQGTFVGNTYYEMSKTPIFGAGTDFSIAADGYVAQFITDAGDPNSLIIPAGNWNFETYFNASSAGGTPSFYIELYKYDGTTFTLIASNSTNPELIAFGTTVNPYFSALAVPETILTVTDRIAIRIYVVTSGRTITLHTENSNLCQIVTTFTRGLTALNGLTAQVQYFQVGTAGTDFNIASATATHTFNLPTASATNRGALSSADWSLFTQAYNDKINSAAVTGTTTKTLTLTQQDGGTITASWSDLNTDAVTSVFGRTGAVVAANGDYTTAQVTESGNLYYTEARVSANTDVAANTAARHNAVTLGTANGLSLSTQQLSLALASGSTTGALSSTDWTTFNNKQNALGYVPVPETRTITINGTSQDLSANRTYNVGTVTSVAALTLGTSGTDLSSTVANGTTTPVITLNVPTASATNRGALSAADWTTFNNKQNTITLTTTGTSGAATLVGSTLNIPQYQAAGTYVTSVTASSPLASSGGTTPNITIQQASGSQNGFLSSTDWTTFNNKVSSQWITTGSNIYYTAGSVLIGTITAPSPVAGVSFPLVVSSSATTRIQINSTQATPNAGVGLYANGVQKFSFAMFGATSDFTIYNDALLQSALLVKGDTNNIIANGTLSIEASATGSTTTQVPVFISDPASTTRELFTRTPAQFRSDIGAQAALTNPVTGTGSTNYLPKFTGSTTIGNSNLINDASGNLGLGVTPSAWLTASGRKAIEIGALGNAMFGNGASDFYMLSNAFTDGTFKYANNGPASSYRHADGAHIWYQAPSGTAAGNPITFTQAMTLFATGNLLVGTPSPISDNGARLQVSGTGRFDVNSQNIILTLNNPDNTKSPALTFAIGGSTRSIIQVNNSNSNFNFLVNSGDTTALSLNGSTGAATFSSSVTAGGIIKSTNAGAGFRHYYNNGSGNIELSQRSDNKLQIYAWNGSAYTDILLGVDGAAVGGNVGIGISNPNIYDSNADNLVIGSTGANDKNGITIVGGDTDGRGSIFFADTTQNSAGYITYLHNNNSLLFGTSDITRLTIASTGAATFSSSVTSSGTIFANTQLNNTVISPTDATNITNGFNLLGSQSYWGIRTTTAGNFALDVYGAGSTRNALTILQASGNVGIGTSSPTSGLELGSGLDLKMPSNGNIIFGNSNVLIYKTSGQDGLSFNTGGSERMRITSSGNVGIGTVSPNAKLLINGTGDLSYIYNSGASTTDANFYIYNATRDILIVRNSGNVGIGTASPARQFVVSNGGANGLEITSVSSGTIMEIISYNRSTSAYTPLQFQSSVYNFNQGNVLIGTTTDSGGKLRVDGDVFINNSSNAQIGFNTTGALNTVGAYQYFNRSGSNKWTAGMGPLDGSDNYQIVTGGVKALQLTVSTGAATFSGTLACSGAFIQPNQTEIFASAGASNRAYAFGLSNAAAGDFVIMQGSTATGGTYTPRLAISPTGNVLIGTTNDNSNKLRVNGNVWLDAPTSGKVSIVNSSGVSTTIGVGATTGYVGTNSDHQLDFFTNNNVLATLKTDGQFEVQKIKTAGPTGGTAQPWRLGSVATVSPTSPNRTIEVEVNGTTYYLHAKTTNN